MHRTARNYRGREMMAGLALVFLACAEPVSAMGALRCGPYLVSTGDLAAQVEARCGPPSYRVLETYLLPRNRGYAADVEIWTYNFGPDRLLEQLRFRNGRLVDISSDGYGFSGSPHKYCRPDDISVGMSEYELWFMCGEPISKSAGEVTEPLGFPEAGGGVFSGYMHTVYRQEWVYNFGPDYFLRDVILENGRVVDIRDGKRGFDANK